MKVEVSIGCDHAGFELKEKIKQFLLQKEFKVTDYGTNSLESVDYPDFVHPLCKALTDDQFGILVCGSGNGVAITANKYAHIRAALCWDVELAKLAREHNNANVLCLPARFISDTKAFESVEVFLKTDFQGGRHAQRVKKIALS